MYLQIITIILCIINIVLVCYNKVYLVGNIVYFYVGSELMVGVVKSTNLIEVVDDFGVVHTLHTKQIKKRKKRK